MSRPAREVGLFLLLLAMGQAIFLTGVLIGTHLDATAYYRCALIPLSTLLFALTCFLPSTKDNP